jgi:hypothetical protein
MSQNKWKANQRREKELKSKNCMYVRVSMRPFIIKVSLTLWPLIMPHLNGVGMRGRGSASAVGSTITLSYQDYSIGPQVAKPTTPNAIYLQNPNKNFMPEEVHTLTRVTVIFHFGVISVCL